VCHWVDLLRIGVNSYDRLAMLMDPEWAKELMAYAEKLLRATGNRVIYSVMHQPEQGYQDPLFIICSTDPQACLEHLQKVERGKIAMELVPTFSMSKYLHYYGPEDAPNVEMIYADDELWGVVREHVVAHFTRAGGSYQMNKTDARREANLFINDLKRETLENISKEKLIVELLDEVSGIAMRIWSSTVKCKGREFCSFLNESIREDWPETVQSAAQIARCINQLLVNRRGIAAERILQTVSENGCKPTLCNTFDEIEDIFDNTKLLKDEEAHWCITFRGGGILPSKKAFFRQGTKYRTPQFLATSFSKKVQTDFMKCRGTGLDAIRWYFHVPLGYCQHAALLEKSNMGTAEFEYLFTPFSVFTVMYVKWSEDPRNSEPHEIHLRASDDNKVEAEDLPSAPWC